MAKEVCTMFEVWAKQLSKLLLGKVYLGGTGRATKGKCKRSHTVVREGNVVGEDTEPPTKKWMRCKTIVSPCHSYIYSEA